MAVFMGKCAKTIYFATKLMIEYAIGAHADPLVSIILLVGCCIFEIILMRPDKIGRVVITIILY